MDKVTQQNAANAEESASASEEMNAQAEQMKGMVDDLVSLVGGSRNKAGSMEYAVGSRNIAATKKGKAIVAPAGKSRGKELAVHQAREVNADQIIPLGDEDFENF